MRCLLYTSMAAAQAALKLLKGRRHHKNADRVRPLLADLVHTLHVDVQQDMHTPVSYTHLTLLYSVSFVLAGALCLKTVPCFASFASLYVPP